MSEPIIYFIEDQESQRKMLEWDLRDLFGAGYQIASLPLNQKKEYYHHFLDDPMVLGLLIDQRLNETGEVTSYSGVDLATHLRGLYPDMPIYIITGHNPDEQIKGPDAGAADAVVHKAELRAGTPDSVRFRQRFLRHAGRYQDALTSKQKRFRELLTKSLYGQISPEERAELASLEEGRLLSTQAVEAGQVSKLQKDIEAIERLLDKLPKRNEHSG